MDLQVVQWAGEGLIGLLGVFIAFVLNSLRKGQEAHGEALQAQREEQRAQHESLKQADDAIRRDFNEWRVHVATNYVPRDESASQHREVLAAIQRLEAGIATLQREKQDK
jgi:hypothetical protein